MNRRQLSSGQKALVLIVVIGTIVISLIGFVGSYDAVLKLAQRNGFGWFSYLLPVGIDVGITVFLALDLLLTWMRIPLPLLRQLAWVLTGATIVFNAASAWPNPLASGMHAVVPLLFVAAIEAARHTVGRLAQIEANTLFERTRLGRWVFAPVATMRLFRRRMLWELRSYEEALEHERRRLVYRARLRATYGRLWRHRAPVDVVLLLKLANLGEPLPEFKIDVAPALVGAAVAAAPVADNTVKALLPQPREERPTSAAEPAVAIATNRATPAAESSPQPVGADEPAEPVGCTDMAPDAGPEHSSTEAVPAAPEVPEREGPGEPPQAPEPRLHQPVVLAAEERQAAATPKHVPLSTPTPPAQGSAVDRFRMGFLDYTQRHGTFPDGDQLSKWLFDEHGVAGRSGDPLSAGHLRRYLPGFKESWEANQQAAAVTARE
ncbi:DUF2637 domain-containing protein [Streptacidiphilus neutrinimicus]|uniref:DUF2637 domain-containing protein n=1 Tax=Streptacidiphilus neutrinimicus TaxID=105420 RepID=UPI0005A70D13|nr:DUF2637 domain-containing protein [Streptacidiphilus neutrinimicus]